MGGRGSGGGRGYSLPLSLTREMRIALTKLAAQESSDRDFLVALKAMRAGLIVYGVLNDDDLQAMYRRGKVSDDEALFLMEAKLCKDFRPVKLEALLQAEEMSKMNHFFGQVLEQWDSLMESSKMGHLEKAKKYPQLSNAVKIVQMVKEAQVRSGSVQG